MAGPVVLVGRAVVDRAAVAALVVVGLAAVDRGAVVHLAHRGAAGGAQGALAVAALAADKMRAVRGAGPTTGKSA